MHDDRWQITTAEEDGSFVVKPHGEIDMYTAPELDAALRGVNGQAALICDLSEVTFIDSAGIHLLIDALKREPDRLTLRGATEPVERLLKLTGTDRLFRRTVHQP